jgi:chromosome segregation ATPase
LERLRNAFGHASSGQWSHADQAEQYERRLEAARTAHDETRRTLDETQRKLLETQRRLTEAQQLTKGLAEANLGLHAQVRQLERDLNAPVWQRVFR